MRSRRDQSQQQLQKVDHFLSEFQHLKRENKQLRMQLDRERAISKQLQSKLTRLELKHVGGNHKQQTPRETRSRIQSSMTTEYWENKVRQLERTNLQLLKTLEEQTARQTKTKEDSKQANLQLHNKIYQLQRINQKLLAARLQEPSPIIINADTNEGQVEQLRSEVNRLMTLNYKLEAKLKQGNNTENTQSAVLQQIKRKVGHLQASIEEIGRQNRQLKKSQILLKEVRQEDFVLVKMLEAQPGHLTELTAQKLLAADCL